MRRRLQVPQKWSDMLLINPKLPIYPGIDHDRAVSFNSSEIRNKSGWHLEIRACNSEEGTIFSLSHLLPIGLNESRLVRPAKQLTGEGHEFDKTNRQGHVLGHFNKIQNFVIIEPFNNNNVQLDGFKPGVSQSSVKSTKDSIVARSPSHKLELDRIQSIETKP